VGETVQNIKIFLFGPPRVEIGANRVETGLRKSTALLAYLTFSNQPFDRETLASLFWPEDNRSTALGNLRRAIYRIQRMLGTNFIVAKNKTVERNLDLPIWVDVALFHQITASAESQNAAQLQYAAELYTADFMAGFSLPDSPGFDDWHFFEAESLRRSLGDVLDRLVNACGSQLDWGSAISYARRLVLLDPLNERTNRRLMELYAQTDQVPAALRQYEELRLRLQNELNLEPDLETVELYEAVRKRQVANYSQTFINLTSPTGQAFLSPGPFHNLPAQPSVFIGRKAEVDSIKHLLVDDPNCRLLTIVGPGGIGKTRLALEAAYGALRAFADGTCFVSLAPLSSPDHIAPALMENLGLHFFDDRLAETYLLNFLHEKRMLLVLDNAEHLLVGMDLVARILQSAPSVKILITSRDRLNLTGEMVFSLGAMDYPEKQETGDFQSYAAVQLLMHYARMSRPDLIFDERALEGIVQISRLVQGMPLALVLAAGWVEVLTFSEIAKEIAENLDFLESEARDIPERQRSVRAAFEYSWRRLSADDQMVFSNLSVFREGFSRQAAEQVAGASLRILRNLIDRSFLTLQQNGQYSIHELLRQFGEEDLHNSGRAEVIKARHSHYFLSFIETLEKDIKGLKQYEALDLIDTDFENIHIAWDWAVIHRADDDINRAVETLYLYFAYRSRYLEGAEFLGNAHRLMIPRPGGEPPLVCGRVMARYAWILALHRKPEAITEGYIQRCSDLALKSGDQREIAFSYLLQGCYDLYSKQDAQHALESLERCYEIYRSLDDPFYIGIALLWLSSCHAEATGLKQMMAYSRQSYEMALTTGNKALIPFSLRNLARGALYSGDYIAAEQYNIEAGVYQERMGLRMGLAESKIELSLIHFLKGDLKEARILVDEGLGIARVLSYMWVISEGLAMLSLYEATCSNYTASKALAEESLATPSSFISNVLAHWALAMVMCGFGQPEQARPHIEAALSYAHRLSYNAVQIWPLPVAAYLLALTSSETTSAELLSFALNHPQNRMGWTAYWKPFKALDAVLKTRLGKEKFDSAWSRGKTLQLKEIFPKLSSIISKMNQKIES
jgi:predicted ATPase/DNA-binding SARP family transcriptional activator